MPLPGMSWGGSEDERCAATPVDPLLPRIDERWLRACDVAAPAAVLWRWLWQLQVAPYSYDWVDNLGRRSPRTLTHGLRAPAPGDPILMVMRVVAVEPGRRLSLLSRSTAAWAPRMGMDYEVVDRGPASSRLVLRIPVCAPPLADRAPRVGRAALAALRVGDLVMARKQVRTLGALAERTARTPG